MRLCGHDVSADALAISRRAGRPKRKRDAAEAHSRTGNVFSRHWARPIRRERGSAFASGPASPGAGAPAAMRAALSGRVIPIEQRRERGCTAAAAADRWRPQRERFHWTRRSPRQCYARRHLMTRLVAVSSRRQRADRRSSPALNDKRGESGFTSESGREEKRDCFAYERAFSQQLSLHSDRTADAKMYETVMLFYPRRRRGTANLEANRKGMSSPTVPSQGAHGPACPTLGGWPSPERQLAIFSDSRQNEHARRRQLTGQMLFLCVL